MATRRQLEYLEKLLGRPPSPLLDFVEASALIRQIQERDRAGPATFKQQALLQRLGLWRPGLRKGEASELITEALNRTRRDL
jgi:hypothetical protein